MSRGDRRGDKGRACRGDEALEGNTAHLRYELKGPAELLRKRSVLSWENRPVKVVSVRAFSTRVF